MNRSKLALSLSLIVSSTLLGCAGTQTSQFSYNEALPLNTASKGEKCYDASILAGASLSATKDITKKVIIAIDASIHQETPLFIKAQRNRHIGVFVGSGGEEIFVNFKEVTPKRTFVTVTTKTGFVGGAGQKAWSCKVVDEMTTMLNK